MTSDSEAVGRGNQTSDSEAVGRGNQTSDSEAVGRESMTSDLPLHGAERAATTLPAEDQAARDALAAALADGRLDAVREVARAHPAYLDAWGCLAEAALDAGDDVGAYACARVGYHRGLDAIRRAGWRGQGPVPWSHEPNRGFLRSLWMLGRAAAAIGERDEAERCAAFLSELAADHELSVTG
jgi:hypothetical protein